jgi:hypothetical protein
MAHQLTAEAAQCRIVATAGFREPVNIVPSAHGRQPAITEDCERTVSLHLVRTGHTSVRSMPVSVQR